MITSLIFDYFYVTEGWCGQLLFLQQQALLAKTVESLLYWLTLITLSAALGSHWFKGIDVNKTRDSKLESLVDFIMERIVLPTVWVGCLLHCFVLFVPFLLPLVLLWQYNFGNNQEAKNNKFANKASSTVTATATKIQNIQANLQTDVSLAKPAEPSVSTYTPQSFSLEVTQEAQSISIEEPERIETTAIKRNPEFAKNLKLLHNNTCLVCGKRRLDRSGNPEVEAAHIYPLSLGGPDHLSNGLTLCRYHHWAFDRNLFCLTDDYFIVVNPFVQGKAEHSELNNYHHKKLKLVENAVIKPDVNFIKLHRNMTAAL